MHSESLPELINRFVSYKRANGYQYQTGAYYLKKYAGFVMETAPETTVPDKATVERFLETFRIPREAFITQLHFCVSLAGIFLPAASGRILSLLEGFIFPRRFSRIFLRNKKSLRSSGNATGPWRLPV